MTITMPPEEAEAELAKLYTERMGKPVTVHIAVPSWTNTADAGIFAPSNS